MCDQHNNRTKIRRIPLLVSVMSELLARRLWMNPERPSLGEQQTARNSGAWTAEQHHYSETHRSLRHHEGKEK